MDGYGMSAGGSSFSGSGVSQGIPLGFGMALSMNEPAMKRYANMTEAEKERIIMRCKDAKSKDEMQKIVDSLVPDGNMNSLYEGPAGK